MHGANTILFIIMKHTILYILTFSLLLCSCGEGADEVQDALLLPELKDQLQTISHSGKLMDTASIDQQIDLADSIWAAEPQKLMNILINASRQSFHLAYRRGMVRAMGNIGKIYLETGNPDTALLYFKQALIIAKQTDPSLGLTVDIYNGMAAVYFQLSLVDTAAIYAYKAIDELNQYPVKKPERAALVHRNMGAFWLARGDNEQALFYLNKAKEFAHLAKDSTRLLDIAVNKACIYYNKRQDDSAMVVFQRLLHNPLMNNEMKIMVKQYVGDILCRQDKPENGILYYTEAYQLSKETNNRFSILQSYLKLGQAYFWLADYKKAEHIFREVLSESEKIGRGGSNIEYIHLYLAEIYGKLNNFEYASHQLAQAIAIKDSLYKKEKVELRNKLDVQYRVAEKDKLLLQQENKLKNKNILIGGLSLSALFLCAFLVSAYRSHQHKKQVHAKELLLLEQQQEIKQLQSMMKGEEKERARLARELHDGVGGMLASIKMNVSVAKDRDNAAVKTADLEEVLLLVEQTADEVRRTAHNLMPEVLRKYNLPQALRMYCESLKNGTAPQIDLQFHSEWPEERLELELPLYRIIQELIQNIIKHAQAYYVAIQFRFQDDKLHVTVEDDGIGFETDKVGSGLGLSNIRSRVTALRGNIFIESSPGRGATCYLELPAENQKEQLS